MQSAHAHMRLRVACSPFNSPACSSRPSLCCFTAAGLAQTEGDIRASPQTMPGWRASGKPWMAAVHHSGAHECCACHGCLLLASHPQTRTSLAHYCRQAGGLHGAMDGGSVQGPRHAAEPDAGRVRAGRYRRGGHRAQGACARKCALAAKLHLSVKQAVTAKFLGPISERTFFACEFAALLFNARLSLGCPESY